MKRLIVSLLLLCLFVPSYAQLWEGEGGHLIEEGETDENCLPYETVQEGIGQRENPIPPVPPLDPNAVYTFYMPNSNAEIVYGADAENKIPVHYDSDSRLIVDGDWTNLIDEIFTPVMLKSDGTVDYELSKTDYRFRTDGVTLSDASNENYDGNAMVRVKKFYVKAESGNSTHPEYNASFSISLVKADSDFEALGFVNADGVECDYAYMSMFEGYVDSNNKLRSLAGVIPTFGTTTNKHDYFVEKAKANGNGWNIESRSFKTALDYLHILLFKDIRPVSQTGQGYRTTDGSVTLTTGQSLGKFNTYLPTMPKTANNGRSKTFWIENFLDGNYRWINGFYRPSSAYKVYTKNSEPYTTNDLTNWNLWECFYSNTMQIGKVKLAGNSNATQVYYPIFKNNTVMFNNFYNASTAPLYNNLRYWKNIDQYIHATNIDNYAMTGQDDYIVYTSTVLSVESFFNSVLTINSLGTSLGNGRWHRNCIGRLIYLSQPASLVNSYNSVQNLSAFSAPKSMLQVQPITNNDEQINIISTDSMEVDQ